jgi:hypothetical protein
MIVVVEEWECFRCQWRETTGGALPRGWRYVAQGEATRVACALCLADRPKAQEGPAERDGER